MAANTRTLALVIMKHDGGELEHAFRSEQLLIQHRLFSNFLFCVRPLGDCYFIPPQPPPAHVSVRDISSFCHILFPFLARHTEGFVN